MTIPKIPGFPDVLAWGPAVVVLSGGQDSVTCLHLAMALHDSVFAISFRYGQKHETELAQAAEVCKRYAIPHSVVDLSFYASMVTSALVSDGDTTQAHAYKPGLPASFVPNRNALFLTLAHAHAQEVGARYIYTGVCETDFPGYPDCRAGFIAKLGDALNTGYLVDIEILTPMMYLDKASTFALARELGVLAEVIEDSHTCYNGDRSHLHDWGYGCGKCPACNIRERGFNAYMAGEYSLG